MKWLDLSSVKNKAAAMHVLKRIETGMFGKKSKKIDFYSKIVYLF